MMMPGVWAVTRCQGDIRAQAAAGDHVYVLPLTGPGITGCAPSWTLQAESWSTPHTGEVAAALGRNGPTPHLGHGKTGPYGMGLGELALPLA